MADDDSGQNNTSNDTIATPFVAAAKAVGRGVANAAKAVGRAVTGAGHAVASGVAAAGRAESSAEHGLAGLGATSNAQRHPNVKGASAGESGYPSHMAPQHPVSHPGTSATHTPMKAAVGNRGHSVTHPPKSPMSHAAPQRHTRPSGGVSKATGGTQHTHSSGTKAGQGKAPTHSHTKATKTKSKSKSKSKSSKSKAK